MARGRVGAPYRFGGRGPDQFDCSGLVYYAYGQAGIPVPRTSMQQFKATQAISVDEARPGDLLFFSYEKKVSHVAIYLGNRQFVHAPATGYSVSFASLDDGDYLDHLVRAGRLFPLQ